MTAAKPSQRAGLFVLIASFGGHIGNYLFYVVAAHMVSPGEFAAISALVSLGNISITPINGLQAAVARDVAVLHTSGTEGALSAYLRRLGGRMGIACVIILAVLGGVSGVLADRLHIGSAIPVILAVMWTVAMTVHYTLLGVTQGLERFGYLAFALSGSLGMFRPLLLPVGILIAGVSGSMWAMILATLIGVVVLVRPVSRSVRVPPTSRPAMPSTLVTMVGLLMFASLTNADLLVAQAGLATSDRALYAAAVLLGKIALFAPVALALVLLPQATAALERGERTEALVLRTIGLTAAAGLLVVGVLWAMPTSLVTLTFGPTYGAAKPLLAPLALVMTAAAVLFVHVMFATARRSRRMTVVLAIGAAVHWALLILLHDSPQHIILASGIAIGGTMIAIEVGSSAGIIRLFSSWQKARPAAMAGQ